ncbi:MAG: SDR family oxidoreductase [Sphingomonas oligoaromativorans]
MSIASGKSLEVESATRSGTPAGLPQVMPLLTQGGSIILISSVLGSFSFPSYGTYGASKAGLHSLARTWATELADRGIRVNTISPGPIGTPILDKQVSSPE